MRLLVILGSLFLSSCSERPSAPAPYRHHGEEAEALKIKVRKGDSVSKIALRHGIPIQKLVMANKLKPPYKLFVGQVLRVPGAKKTAIAPFDITMPALEPKPKSSITLEKIASDDKPLPDSMVPDIQPGEMPAPKKDITPVPQDPTPVEDPDMPLPNIPVVTKKPVKKDMPVKTEKPVKAEKETKKDKKEEKAAEKTVKEAPAASKKETPAPKADVSKTALAFRWPTHGDIIRSYKKGKNDGINIAAPEGSQVFAAEAGTVAYVGDKLPGFGNLIMIKHRNGWMTAYAHTKDVMVKRDDEVKKGQEIAKVGQTGNVNAPQLHFEIRKRTQAVDPEPLLE